jgi:hypothetical protein
VRPERLLGRPFRPQTTLPYKPLTQSVQLLLTLEAAFHSSLGGGRRGRKDVDYAGARIQVSRLAGSAGGVDGPLVVRVGLASDEAVDDGGLGLKGAREIGKSLGKIGLLS